MLLHVAKLAGAVTHAPELHRQASDLVHDHDAGRGPRFVADVEPAARIEIQVHDLRERVPSLRRDPADPVHLLEIGRERTVLARRRGPSPVSPPQAASSVTNKAQWNFMR